MEYFQTIIGLEIHIELKTKSKMFCSCSAEYYGHRPNTHTCPVCLGLPGALPVPNKKAIEQTILTAMALDCKIPLFSRFDRKNYFYPDLPKGYQISQYNLPLAINGKLKIETNSLKTYKIVKIKRVHLEEDTAKLIHTRYSTLIDFNRSGIPLMEIVTEPDIRSPEEAIKFLKKLQQIIRYLGVSDCDMEKGSMRIEPNISILKSFYKIPKTIKELPNYKVEIKNINSFKFMEKALRYEIERQIKLLKRGKAPQQETRGWNEIKHITYSQRWKEEAQDYRYFPEPDIPPLHWNKDQLLKIKSRLGELPEEKLARFIQEFKLSKNQAEILTSDLVKANYFEKVIKIGKKYNLSAIEIANQIINKKFELNKLKPNELVKNIVNKKNKPKIEEKKLNKIIKEVLKENKKAISDYKKGKSSAIEFLIGQVMKKTHGLADPNETRKDLLEKLRRKK